MAIALGLAPFGGVGAGLVCASWDTGAIVATFLMGIVVVCATLFERRQQRQADAVTVTEIALRPRTSADDKALICARP